jgi:HPt (histidine-containing phosphotransfer) domain-containing protein
MKKIAEIVDRKKSQMDTIKEEIDTIPHFEIESIKEQLGADIVADILIDSPESLEKAYKTLSALVASSDLNGLNSAGHKMYGTAVTLGLTRLAHMLNYFTQMKSFDKRTARSLLAAIKTEMDLVTVLIEAENAKNQS